MTPLPSISDLISTSWDFFKSDWKTITARNAWIIPVMVIYFAFSIAGSALQYSWMILLGVLALTVGSILVTLHVARYILVKDSPSTQQATKELTLRDLFWPTIVIGIVTALSTLGGFMLFLLPGIWFSIAAGFAIFVYIEEGTTGVNALSRSMELVKGRWWKTFWRLVLPSIVFQAISGIIALAVFAVPTVIAVIGGAAALSSFSEGGAGGMAAASIPLLIVAGILFLVALLISFFLSLIVTGLTQVVQTKLFHALKDSR